MAIYLQFMWYAKMINFFKLQLKVTSQFLAFSGHVDETFVWKICTQVISALKECHSRQKNGKAVLHRDLKPANVFLDADTNAKLGDFGLARVLNHDTSFAKTFVGTPYYMSPVSSASQLLSVTKQLLSFFTNNFFV